MKHLKLLLLTLIIGLSSACAGMSNKNAVTNDNLNIKNVNSSAATVNLVNIESTAEGTMIRGQLRRKYSAKTAIPGHLDITITDPNGKVQYSGQVGYMRVNRNSAYSRFSLALDEAVAKGSTVTIKHHETANIVDRQMKHH